MGDLSPPQPEMLENTDWVMLSKPMKKKPKAKRRRSVSIPQTVYAIPRGGGGFAPEYSTDDPPSSGFERAEPETNDKSTLSWMLNSVNSEVEMHRSASIPSFGLGGEDVNDLLERCQYSSSSKSITRSPHALSAIHSPGRPEEWFQRPLYVRKSCSRMPQQEGMFWEEEELTINAVSAVTPFETKLFQGKFHMKIANLPSSPEEYFRGRARQQQVVVQGEFKKRVCAADILTGQRFDRPFLGLPAVWIIKALTSILRHTLPNVQVDLFSRTPFFETHLLAGCQALRVEPRGQECDLTGPLEEDTSLLCGLGGGFYPGGRRVTSAERKRFFGCQANLRSFYFEPGLIYTFDIYQHQFDISTFEALIGPLRVDLSKFMNAQPLHMMARCSSEDEGREDQYLWDFELWHEKIILAQQQQPLLPSPNCSAQQQQCTKPLVNVCYSKNKESEEMGVDVLLASDCTAVRTAESESWLHLQNTPSSKCPTLQSSRYTAQGRRNGASEANNDHFPLRGLHQPTTPKGPEPAELPNLSPKRPGLLASPSAVQARKASYPRPLKQAQVVSVTSPSEGSFEPCDGTPKAASSSSVGRHFIHAEQAQLSSITAPSTGSGQPSYGTPRAASSSGVGRHFFHAAPFWGGAEALLEGEATASQPCARNLSKLFDATDDKGEQEEEEEGEGLPPVLDTVDDPREETNAANL